MRRSVRFVLLIAALAGCVTNPYTGRRQLILLDRETELALGAQAYQEQLSQEKKLTDDPLYFAPVARVARRLSAEAEKGSEGIEPPKFQWQFEVIDDPKTANAWCLPGGKIAVYTGIFPICRDENGLAVVAGHEIMHAILHHGNERVSQGMLSGIGTDVLATALGGDDPRKKKAIQSALGIGTSVGILLPYSRTNETEADEFGLYLAARAGYDPRAGIEVWKRMEQMGKTSTPEFLSTHPGHERRIQNMEGWMPKALELYERSERQPATLLPEPGKARPSQAARLTGGMLSAGGAKKGEAEGAPGAQFEFTTRQSVFIEAVRVRGPGGIDVPVETKTGVPAGEKRHVTIRRREAAEGALPSGAYTLAFEGRVNGQPWSESVGYRLD